MLADDEAALVSHIAETGGRFIPNGFPQHPLPVLSPLLPSAAELYFGAVCIWYDDIFTERELLLESKTPFNPVSGLYFASVLPVLLFERPRSENGKLRTGVIQFNASARSFRFGRRYADYTETELADFSERLAHLQNRYRQLGRWIRKTCKSIGRGQFIGPEAAKQLEAGRVVLP